MKSLPTHAAGWIPTILVIVGAFAMAVGMFATSALATSPAALDLPPHAAVYVGGDTCYTCHTDEFDGWSASLDLQAMAEAAAKPKMIVADVSARAEVPQVDVDKFADACTGSDDTAAGLYDLRQYVVRTDIGATVLPRDWNAQDVEALREDERAVAQLDCAVDGANRNIHDVSWTTRPSSSGFGRNDLAVRFVAATWRTITKMRIITEAAFMEGQSA